MTVHTVHRHTTSFLGSRVFPAFKMLYLFWGIEYHDLETHPRAFLFWGLEYHRPRKHINMHL